MNELRKFSIDQLLSEIARRHKLEKNRRDGIQWCEGCKNFRPFKPLRAEEMPENYNPCRRGHEMQFLCPDFGTDEGWGFYRRVCGDREAASCN